MTRSWLSQCHADCALWLHYKTYFFTLFSVPPVPMGIYVSPSVRLDNTGMCIVTMLHKTDVVVHVMQAFNLNM